MSLPDGDDSNRSRWPVHPVWQVVQVAFMHPAPSNPGPVVRFRVREKNLERGVAATIGYLSTLAAWLGNSMLVKMLIFRWCCNGSMVLVQNTWKNENVTSLKRSKRNNCVMLPVIPLLMLIHLLILLSEVGGAYAYTKGHTGISRGP